MKEIWTQQWDEFTTWFITQWKYAWELLKTSIIGLIQSIFEWLYTVAGTAIGGLWKLVLVPVGKYTLEKLIELVKKL